MKNIIFIFALLIFTILSCKSTPKTSTSEEIISAEEIIIEDDDIINANLYLPENTSIRDTSRGKIFETNPKIIFKFTETNMPATADVSFSQVIDLLNNNSNISIILEAHTSNKGQAYPANYNLSLLRAMNGKNYLINNGIDKNRIIENPLGEALPEYPNQYELRRYEFVIIENEEDLKKYNDYISTLDVKAESTYKK